MLAQWLTRIPHVRSFLLLAITLAALGAAPAHAYVDELFATAPGTYAPPSNYGSYGPASGGFPEPSQSFTPTGSYTTPIKRLTKAVDGNGNFLPSESEIYGKNGFWNANGTVMIHKTAQNGWKFIDTSTGTAVANTVVPSGSVPTWDGSFAPDAANIWYWHSGSKLMAYDLNSNTSSQVYDFGAALGPMGGSADWVDRDGKYMVLRVGSALKVFNKHTGQELDGAITGGYGTGNGWAGISPDGKYVVTATEGSTAKLVHSFEVDQQNGAVSTTPKMVWSLGGDHGRLVSTNEATPKTYFVTYESWDEGAIYRVDVSQNLEGQSPAQQRAANLKLVDVSWADTEGHFGGAAKAGSRWQNWAFISIEGTDDSPGAGPTNWRPFKAEIFMVNVVTGDRRRLAHHRSQGLSNENYGRQPRVSPSWDGERIAWASAFNVPSPGDYGDIYTMDLSALPNFGGGTGPLALSFTNPANGATVSGNTTVSLSASGGAGAYSYVVKLDNTTQIYAGTGNSFSWNTTTASNGSHTLNATVTDAASATATAAISVTVSNGGGNPDPTPPQVSVTAPANNAKVKGSVTLTANATDNIAVTKLQFKLDGSNVGAELTGPPWQITWNTATASNGAHTLTATAWDAANNQTTSSSVSVTVDNTVPSVSITAPANGATVSGSVTLTATASDNDLVSVQFRVDGANVGGADTASPYSVSWDSTTATNGSHTITAVAVDGAGNEMTSAAVTVTVNNGLGTENVVWTSTVNATASANTLTKSGGCDGCGDAGGISQQTITSGNGHVQFTTPSGVRLTAGLSTGNSGTGSGEIKWGLQFYPGPPMYVEVRESGVWKASWNVAAGDTHKVAVDGGAVKYYLNGVLKYTSAQAPIYPLLLDVSLESSNASVQSAVMARTPGGGQGGPQDVAWTSAVNATPSGGTLTKSGGCNGCGDAGAVSQQTIASGDGSVTFGISSGARLTAGLSNGNAGTGSAEIKWGLQFYPGSPAFVEVRESDVWKASWSIAAGDTHKVAVEGGVVKYYRNGVLQYTSAQSPSYPLLVDVSLESTSASVQGAVISGAP